MSEIHQKTVDAILHELGSRRMLDDIDDDLHQEIGEAVAVVAGVPALIALIARAETAEKRLAEAVAAEREACAKIAEQQQPYVYGYSAERACRSIAAGIRARGSAEAQADGEGV